MITRRISGARACDKAAVERLLHQAYGSGVKCNLSASTDQVAMHFMQVSVGQLTLAKAEVVNFNCSRLSDTAAQIFIPIRGVLKHAVSPGEPDVFADKSRAAVVRPHVRASQEVKKGAAFVLTVPMKGMGERAEAVLDSEIRGDLISEMVHSVDLSQPVHRSLARNVGSAFTELLALETVGISELAISAYDELLSNLSLCSLFPSVAAKLARPYSSCGRAVVVQARDYIADNAMRPIVLTKLAATLGTSMRSLQISFQKHFGLSPRDFIVECRLEMARKLLMSDGLDSGVTKVALECGFSNLSHFAAKYRDRYGERPSASIRRHRS